MEKKRLENAVIVYYDSVLSNISPRPSNLPIFCARKRGAGRQDRLFRGDRTYCAGGPCLSPMNIR
jgi:hypothetical protein